MDYKRAIFFDIDHTLYNPNDKTIPASTVNALKKLSERKDTLIAVATGRAFYMLEGVIDPLRPYIEAYITINGQTIHYHGKLIHDEPMDKKLAVKARKTFQRLGLTYGFIGADSQVVNRLNGYVKSMFIDQRIPLPKVDPEYDKHHKVYQMWAFGDAETLKKVRGHIDPSYIVPWVSDGFDIIDPKRNKFHGIERLIDRLEIPMDKVYCFGDGANDLQMLKGVPHSFAMANASDSVKKHAKYTTAAFDENGIEKALKWLKLID